MGDCRDCGGVGGERWDAKAKMTTDQLKKLRGYYQSLQGMVPIFQTTSLNVINQGPVLTLAAEIERIANDFPDLLPPLDIRSHMTPRRSDLYYSQGISSLLSVALGRLGVAIEEFASAPVTQPKEFPFIRNIELRKILERDYQEMQKAYVAGCWKSVIILAGGSIEAILIDQLLEHEARAKASTKACKNKSGQVLDIREWGFVYLIVVSVELQLINPGVDKHSHSLREYRDLVHPAVEIRSKLKVDLEEARIALEVLNMVHRDLTK